jgi:hypothetical protein
MYPFGGSGRGSGIVMRFYAGQLIFARAGFIFAVFPSKIAKREPAIGFRSIYIKPGPVLDSHRTAKRLIIMRQHLPGLCHQRLNFSLVDNANFVIHIYNFIKI